MSGRREGPRRERGGRSPPGGEGARSAPQGPAEQGWGPDGSAGGAGQPVPFPIDGTLDLHAFRPAEVKDLVPEWLLACRARGLTQVRIVHGKGTGALRRTVHALLERSPLVRGFRPADEAGGGWGATLVDLAEDARGD